MDYLSFTLKIRFYWNCFKKTCLIECRRLLNDLITSHFSTLGFLSNKLKTHNRLSPERNIGKNGKHMWPESFLLIKKWEVALNSSHL